MNDQRLNLAQYRQQIAELLHELEQITDSDSTETVELDQSRVGRLSRMDALQSQQMGLAQKRRTEMRIKALEGALKRIESGDFGYCFVCGEAINPQRLDFDPTVTRCINCTE